MSPQATHDRCKLTGKRSFYTPNGAQHAAKVFSRRHGKEYAPYTCWYCKRIHLFTK